MEIPFCLACFGNINLEFIIYARKSKYYRKANVIKRFQFFKESVKAHGFLFCNRERKMAKKQKIYLQNITDEWVSIPGQVFKGILPLIFLPHAIREYTEEGMYKNYYISKAIEEGLIIQREDVEQAKAEFKKQREEARKKRPKRPKPKVEEKPIFKNEFISL